MKRKISKAKSFQYRLKARYGITPTDYLTLLHSQNNKCAICGKDYRDEKRRLAVDHSHKTKFIRGLLCTYCNSRLMRYLRDNKKRAEGLVKYLTEALRNDHDWQN